MLSRLDAKHHYNIAVKYIDNLGTNSSIIIIVYMIGKLIWQIMCEVEPQIWWLLSLSKCYNISLKFQDMWFVFVFMDNRVDLVFL